MENDSFYLTVNSNTENPTGGENKPQKFIVKTLFDQALNGEWEVGLTNLRYPNSWYNVTTNMSMRYHVLIENDDPSKSDTDTDSISKRVIDNSKTDLSVIWLPAGFYESMEVMLSYLNKTQNDIVFKYDSITKRITIKLAKPNPNTDIGIRIGQDEILSNLLGFKGSGEQAMFYGFGGDLTASKEASLTLHFPAIYIYSDIVKHQSVNGMMVQLLFDDTISGEAGKYTERRIGTRDAMYLTVAKKYISQIKFEIRDDTGELIKFQAGKVQIRLHFRPKQI